VRDAAISLAFVVRRVNLRYDKSVKTVNIEQTDLEACVDQARRGRVIITRNGTPVAIIVGIEGLDQDRSNWVSAIVSGGS